MATFPISYTSAMCLCTNVRLHINRGASERACMVLLMCSLHICWGIEFWALAEQFQLNRQHQLRL